jgi:serine protease Do
VLVAKVDAGGAAARAGIRPGDVISEVNRQPVGTMADFMRLTRGTVERDAVVLRARRGTSSFYAEITVP